jgi:hypothetical protein
MRDYRSFVPLAFVFCAMVIGDQALTSEHLSDAVRYGGLATSLIICMMALLCP